MFVIIRRAMLFMVGLTLPLESLATVEVGGYPIGINKAMTAALLAFAFVTWPLTGRRLPSDRKHVWIAAFGLGVAVSALQAAVLGVPLLSVLINSSSFAAVILFCFLIVYTVTDRGDLDLLLWSLVLGSVVSVGYGVATGGGVIEGRYYGSFYNPNELAYVLCAVLPLSFALYFKSRSFVLKLFLAGAAIAGTAGIVATLSRSAFLACAAMFGLWIVRFRRLDTLRYVVPALILALGVSFFAPTAFYERVGSLSREGLQEDGSTQKRMMMNYWAVRGFLARPIIGHGVLRIGPWVHQREPRIGAGHAVHHAYLAVATSSGLLGFVPFLIITIFTWRDFSMVWRTARAREFKADPELAQLGHLAIFLQLSLLGGIVNAQFHPNQREKAFWLLVGLSSTLIVLARARVLELRAKSEAPEDPPEEFHVFDPSLNVTRRPAGVVPR
jgi:O-antigen ligase